ncbi:uncharacterized protein LOC103353454 [Stegastes partitus]|uniref:Uncharacterized protein LOC103353454 n=1 Tax=Stegastes partitus TaxID=144197 RepID=A0A9Y4JHU0_9TELE|nr:PREDICTED: uncharacterized protein LOC103353454 [Stegastes partitus]
MLGEYTSLEGEVAVIPIVVKTLHEGSLVCVASAQNNSEIVPTASHPHSLKVVEPVNGAQIVHSGPVELYEGNTLELHCEVTAGNYVSYKWLLDGQLISQSPFHYVAENHLRISRTSSEDSGSYMCVATNTFNKTRVFSSYSSEVVFIVKDLVSSPNVSFTVLKEDSQNYSAAVTFPVGGSVMMQYDFDFGENYAIVGLRFYCKLEKGSHPQFQWFLNKTRLHDRGSFYYVWNQHPKQSMLQLSVGRSSTGTYHCEVSDSFDNTTAISSKRQYLDKDVLNRLPILVVAVVFGCFTALILMVSICCCIGVMFRQRQYGEKSLWNLEMERMNAAYEGDLDLSVYNEDPDVVKTARGDEFDQPCEASVDELPEIEEEKKTLEDELV